MRRAIALLLLAGCTLPTAARTPGAFYALALSPSTNRVEVIDLLVNRTVKQLTTGEKPVSLGVSNDATRILVANELDGTVNAFLRRDPETFVDLGVVGIGEKPKSVQFHPNPDLREAYVTDEKTGQVVILDWRRSYRAPGVAAKFPIRVSGDSGSVSLTHLAVSPDGGRLFVADQEGRLHILSRTGLGQVSLQNSVTLNAASAGGVRIEGLVSPDANQLLATNAAKSDLYVLDAVNGAVRMVIDLTGNQGPAPVSPMGIAVNPARTKAYVACSGSSTLAVVDLRQLRLIKHIALAHSGTSPSGVAVSADSRRVYVTNASGRHLSIIEAQPEGEDGVATGVGLSASAHLLAPLSDIRLL